MALHRCLSCGGKYNPDQPGGYYHACPPITLPDGTWKEREDKRDENIDDTIPEKPKKRAEGKGRVKVKE